jgi:hypothetical protein
MRFEVLFSLNFFLIQSTFSLIDCDNVLSDEPAGSFTGLCNNKWSNLKKLIKPTQAEVGYAWVQHKLEDYDTKSHAQDEMDQNPIPAVIGPNNIFYVVDHHHELSALDYSGYSDVSVTLNVSCDQRLLPTMNAFWDMMTESHLVYLGAHPNGNLNALPIQITPQDLPQDFIFTKDFKSFGNDPWRSLASFARKVNSYYLNSSDCLDDHNINTDLCYRAYYRGCVDGFQSQGPGVAFYEFQWSYFLLDGTYFQPQYWPNADQRIAFLESFSEQETGKMGSYDMDEWFVIASLVVPLARSKVVSSYQPPEALFASKALPGYIVGDVPIVNDDPTCDSPSCRVD